MEKEVHEICFTSTSVDPAANMELVGETAKALTRIFEETNWDVRILSKSNMLPKLAETVPKKFRQRMIFGVSTGTLDDNLGRAIERGTPLVSKRIQSLHWLQDHGFRTYGMICPSLPQPDYDEFSRSTCEAIRVDCCEHVWAEPINTRGKSFPATVNTLKAAGFDTEASALERVCGHGSKVVWDDYAKATFLAHTKNIPPSKLRFLHYPTKSSFGWWQEQIGKGAVLLGKVAQLPHALPAAVPIRDMLPRSRKSRDSTAGLGDGAPARSSRRE